MPIAPALGRLRQADGERARATKRDPVLKHTREKEREYSFLKNEIQAERGSFLGENLTIN
jgi:hypothetical protein